jgi:hypothetical protein
MAKRTKWLLLLSFGGMLVLLVLGLVFTAHWAEWFSSAHRGVTLRRVLYFVGSLALAGSGAGVRQGGAGELVVALLSLF